MSVSREILEEKHFLHRGIYVEYLVNHDNIKYIYIAYFMCLKYNQVLTSNSAALDHVDFLLLSGIHPSMHYSI